jgi:xanthine dehydrogenase YagR molybdenum-binding subunit
VLVSGGGRSGVNAVTGEPRVSRFLGSFDCRRIINAKTGANQFRGGIIMGLGLALMEETLFDERNGRIMNPSPSEYHVPVHMDVPEIDVIWTDIPDPQPAPGAPRATRVLQRSLKLGRPG